MVRILFSILCLILMAAFIVAEYREKWVAGVAFKGAASLKAVIKRAKGAKGADENGYRAEFIRLVETADLLNAKR